MFVQFNERFGSHHNQLSQIGTVVVGGWVRTWGVIEVTDEEKRMKIW